MRTKQTKTICNRCKKANTFNEYPSGEINYLGKEIDLCDQCVEEGYFIRKYPAGVVAIEHEDDYDEIQE